MNVTLIATGFGEGVSAAASVGASRSRLAAAAAPESQPQENAAAQGQQAVPAAGNSERSAGIQIPDFLRKRSERGK